MSAVFALLSFLVALALSLALVAYALVSLGFSGESYRSGMTWLHVGFMMVAVLVAFVPLGLTLWAFWRRFFSSRPWADVPLGLGLPLVACVVCAGACFLAFIGGELASKHYSDWMGARERAALRVAVDAGAREKACDLVRLDPKATSEDMRRCRAHLESLSSTAERWAVLATFHDVAGFKTWTPAQVGLAPRSDWSRKLVVVRHDQEWFLRTFYETWLARPDALQSKDDLSALRSCLRHSTRLNGWTAAAMEVFRSQLFPEIVRRVESLPAPHRDLLEAGWLREELPKLQASLEQGGEPPTPKLATVPEGTLGLAQLTQDDALHVWLRATPTEGAFGDVYLVYPHSGRRIPNDWEGHLDPMEPGEVRPVPPL